MSFLLGHFFEPVDSISKWLLKNIGLHIMMSVTKREFFCYLPLTKNRAALRAKKQNIIMMSVTKRDFFCYLPFNKKQSSIAGKETKYFSFEKQTGTQTKEKNDVTRRLFVIITKNGNTHTKQKILRNRAVIVIIKKTTGTPTKNQLRNAPFSRS
eukprot:GEMP01055774.1.p1 GENE.GEMP01055774.1~~GEMP01055774.1.p1  ORF type:complete len:154 (-),score=2.94 GEMP01055774.1:552-1013(-)